MRAKSLNRAVSSARNFGVLMTIAAFAGVAIWLVVPVKLTGGAGATTGTDGNAHVAVDGAVRTQSHDNIITRLVIPLTVGGGQGIALTDDSGKLSAEMAMSETAAAAIPATYTLAWLDGNGDRVLDPGEHVELTVDLPAVSTIHPGNPLNLRVGRTGGAALVIENVLGN